MADSGIIEIINGYQVSWIRTGDEIHTTVYAPGGVMMNGVSAWYRTDSEHFAAAEAEAYLIMSGIVHLEDVSEEWKALHPGVGYGR